MCTCLTPHGSLEPESCSCCHFVGAPTSEKCLLKASRRRIDRAKIRDYHGLRSSLPNQCFERASPLAQRVARSRQTISPLMHASHQSLYPSRFGLMNVMSLLRGLCMKRNKKSDDRHGDQTVVCASLVVGGRVHISLQHFALRRCPGDSAKKKEEINSAPMPLTPTHVAPP